MSKKCCHHKDKNICKDCKSICKGTKLCEHNRQRLQCKDCNRSHYMLQLQRNSLRRLLKQSILQKTQKTIEYLGCTPEQFIIHIQSKLTEGMTLNNIHIDHIKPVSRFDLDNEDELKMCCHFTNQQPLLAKDNLKKSNKWSDEEDKYWRENIIYKV